MKFTVYLARPWSVGLEVHHLLVEDCGVVINDVKRITHRIPTALNVQTTSQYCQVCSSAPGHLSGCTSVQLMVLSGSCPKQVTSGKMRECADFFISSLPKYHSFWGPVNVSSGDFVLVYFCIWISHMCSHTTARHGNAIQPTNTCAYQRD